MAFRIIGSSHPKYLAATDILIGDMAGINYEFLIYNRPIILLANKWLCKNFPDIGIKTDLLNIEHAIIRSIEQPNEYEKQRKFWFKNTHHKPDGHSSERVLAAIIKHSKISNPTLVFIHGNSDVLKSNVIPIFNEAKKQDLNSSLISHFSKTKHREGNVYISANNSLLDFDKGYKVHIDHSLKSEGTNVFDIQIAQYKDKNYFKHTDLHITEGEISQKRTKILLGPYADRAIMIGYPKSDTLIRLNTVDNKEAVCNDLGFDPLLPLVTYAPAGKYKYPKKQGASLNNSVIIKLKEIGKSGNFNILIKLKYPRTWFFQRVLNKVISSLRM